MNFLSIAVVSLLTGIAASMGLGGGMILIVYLTLFTNVSQLQAQGINLIFFVPIALLSVILHTKNKLIRWKKIIPSILSGAVSVAVFSHLAASFSSGLLRKLFAAFIILIGIKQLFAKSSK